MTATLKPDFRVRIAGREVPASGSNPLVRVVVEMDMNQPAAAVLTFGGAPEKAIKLGDALEIDLGWTGDVRRVFTGAVLWTRADAPRNRHSSLRRRSETAARRTGFPGFREPDARRDRESARPGSGRGDRHDRGRPARSTRYTATGNPAGTTARGWRRARDSISMPRRKASSTSPASRDGPPITCCAWARTCSP